MLRHLGAAYYEFLHGRIARLLAEHRISGLPVLKMGHEVAGVVTQADLIAAQAETAQRLRSAARRTWWPRRGRRHPALTAGELMTAPAISPSRSS
jgi:CBS-domain-containing membrane protein